MQKPTLTKIYLVEFLRYSDRERTEVTRNDAPKCYLGIMDDEYRVQLPEEHHPFLITEHELNWYSRFGNGYLRIEYVGEMYIPSLANNMELDILEKGEEK